ncbi:unnamed protein product [Prunus armeniaca]|uniref:Stress-induced protein KIN2-like n=1 Tax=Prunus armeniaca TaxID=36596 RepID=A0A6J5UEP9_PRUAR|nr:unnamed protein product [Prunus armeniaca]CAB4305115.1 unnamed protein product [Prunus armeniaca]
MASNSEKVSYHAGEAKGQAEEKASGLMGMANNAAQSTKETVQAAGQNVQAAAVGAVDAVKNATGMNKK